MIRVGRYVENAGWITARWQDWMCPFSGWDTSRECMAQIMDVAVVSCPATRKRII